MLLPKEKPNTFGLLYSQANNEFVITECYVYESDWTNATEDVILPNGKVDLFVVRLGKYNYRHYNPWDVKHILIDNNVKTLKEQLVIILDKKKKELAQQCEYLKDNIRKYEQNSKNPRVANWKECQVGMLKLALEEAERG